MRFRRSEPERIVRSRRPAHPEIISVEDFTQAQLLRRSKGAAGLRTARKTERTRATIKRTFLFRGRIRHTACGRKMEGSPRAHGIYYRCPARTLAPGSAALADHPPTVYLREEMLTAAVNGWIGDLFARENVDRTVAALVASQGGDSDLTGDRVAAKQRLSDAETRLRRLQSAIEAGVEPAAVVDAINEVQALRAAARAELENVPEPNLVTDAEVYAMIDSLGDVGTALGGCMPEKAASLYEALDLEIRYDHETAAADVTIQPMKRVNSVRVRGGSCALSLRLQVPG